MQAPDRHCCTPLCSAKTLAEPGLRKEFPQVELTYLELYAPALVLELLELCAELGSE